MKNLPSIQIPETIPPCDVCHKGEKAISPPTAVSLQDLTDSAKSGCVVCRLHFLAIQRDMLDEESDVTLFFKFRGPVIHVERTLRVGGRYMHLDGNSNFSVYTTNLRLLKPSTSFIGIGRDVGRRESNRVPLITGWLEECHETHPNCPTITDVALPTRVLDIRGDVVRLIEVTPGQLGRYTALSHCWGGGIEVRTTMENYAAQKDGFRQCDLPLSFRDAITVTRGLGLRYLWIDALCIIQDSQSDWEIESGNMAAIYQHAYLVIGADMSPNSEGGFLDVQGGGYHGDGWPIATVDNNIIYARSEHRGNNYHRGAHPLDCEPLSARAWTLQEQFLSSRMVHFASKEMMWECKSALRCECMELDREGHAPDPPLSLRTLTSSLGSFPAKFREWYALIDQVTYRSLTKPEDLLPCLSGITRHFQDSGAGAYLAGLWREDLFTGLLWSTSSGGSRAVPYRGPSWSWASIDQITYPYGESSGLATHENTFKKVHVKIIDAKCIPAGKDPLGAVSDGWLKVVGPLLKMEEDMDIFPHYDSDDFQNESVFCLFIGEFTSGPRLGDVRGLVLRQQCMSASTFERVGWFQLGPGEEVKFIQGIEDSEITIV